MVTVVCVLDWMLTPAGTVEAPLKANVYGLVPPEAVQVAV